MDSVNNSSSGCLGGSLQHTFGCMRMVLNFEIAELLYFLLSQ